MEYKIDRHAGEDVVHQDSPAAGNALHAAGRNFVNIKYAEKDEGRKIDRQGSGGEEGDGPKVSDDFVHDDSVVVFLPKGRLRDSGKVDCKGA